MNRLKTLLAIFVIFMSSTSLKAQMDVVEYNNGELKLIQGTGSLYMYDNSDNAHKGGYRAVYYLFTSGKTVSFANSSDWTGNISLSPSDKSSKWSGYVYKDKETGAWKVAKDGQDHTNLQFNKDEFEMREWNLFIEWSDRAEIRFETDKGKMPKADKSVLLIVLPQLEQDVVKTVTINYRGRSYDVSMFTESIKDELSAYGTVEAELIVERGRGVVIDSMVVDGKRIENVNYSHPTEYDKPYFPEMTVSIPVSVSKEGTTIELFYRRFADNHQIVNEKRQILLGPDVETETNIGLENKTESKVGFWKTFLKIVVIVIAGICVILVLLFVVWRLYKVVQKRKEEDDRENGKVPEGGAQKSGKETRGGCPEGNKSEGDKEDVNETSPDDEEVGTNKDNDSEYQSPKMSKGEKHEMRMLEKKLVELEKKLKEADSRKQTLDNTIIALKGQIFDMEEGCKKVEEKINKAVKKTKEEKDKEIDRIKKKLESVEVELKTSKDEADARVRKVKEEMQGKVDGIKSQRDVAESRAKNAESKAREEAQKDVERIRKECDVVIRKAKEEASAAVTSAEISIRKAKEMAEREIKKAQDDAAKKVKEAEEKAAKEISDKEKECASRIEKWQSDQDKVFAILRTAIRQLVDNVNKAGGNADSSSTIGRNFSTVISGAAKYLQTVEGNINGAWKTLTTSECLAQMCSDAESLLQNSGNWMNILSRFNCYSDVPALNTILDDNGISRADVKAAFSSLQRVLGLVGISIYTPTLSLDKGSDEFVLDNFKMDTSIDRVSQMFADGDMMVMRDLVPDNGKTVFEIGQVAYTTVDNKKQKGKIIYY